MLFSAFSLLAFASSARAEESPCDGSLEEVFSSQCLEYLREHPDALRRPTGGGQLRSAPVTVTCLLAMLVPMFGEPATYTWRLYFADEPPPAADEPLLAAEGWRQGTLDAWMLRFRYTHYPAAPQAAVVVFDGFEPADVRWTIDERGDATCPAVALTPTETTP